MRGTIKVYSGADSVRGKTFDIVEFIGKVDEKLSGFVEIRELNGKKPSGFTVAIKMSQVESLSVASESINVTGIDEKSGKSTTFEFWQQKPSAMNGLEMRKSARKQPASFKI